MPSKKPTPKYQRILLKLSGEALMGDKEFGLDNKQLKALKMDCRNYATMNYSEKNLDLITKHYV